MSLRQAQSALPDEREWVLQLHGILGFLSRHVGEDVTADRVSRATGVSAERAFRVLEILAAAFVISCGGEQGSTVWRYSPDPLTSLEVNRYLRAGTGSQAGIRRGVDRFRDRRGTGW